MTPSGGARRTARGRCPAHGTVDAVKELPRPGFPYLVFAARFAVAAAGPYRCPVCGRAVSRRAARRGAAAEPATASEPSGAAVPAPRTTNGPPGDLPDDAVIAVRGLTMRYGDLDAVRGIDLDVRRGEIVAFLGPNGAGKTTTVEILEGFRRRTAGTVRVLGCDPQTADGAWRARIGVVLQESQPEAELSVRECLTLYAGYYPRPRPVEQTLALVGLGEQADARCAQLSGGQRRRLDVALALVGDPELVFLDEPTTGFDPAARRAAWTVVAGLRTLGATVFLTTHYMDEAEHLADRIVVIASGRIVDAGTPSDIGGRALAESLVAFTLPVPLTAADLPEELLALRTSPDGARVALRTPTPLAHLAVLAAWAAGRGVDLRDLQVGRPTLEDVYLRLVEAHP